MATWHDADLGAGMIRGGLQKIGIQGQVHVVVTTEDGERLEREFSAHATFNDLQLTQGPLMRSCTLSEIHFRWIK